MDYYVLGHNKSSNELTVWWYDAPVFAFITSLIRDSKETPTGGWKFGVGSITDSRNVNMDFQNFNLTGIASPDYDSIGNGTWGAPWKKHPTQKLPSLIHTVHLVFMNHLGRKFVIVLVLMCHDRCWICQLHQQHWYEPEDNQKCSFYSDNEYFHEYFPLAVKVANEMRALGGTDRFKYVTHPWLMSFFLSCPCQDTNSTDCPALRYLT